MKPRLHLIPLADGTLMRSIKLDATSVAALCVCVAEGHTYMTIADWFGLSDSTVCYIYRRVWASAGIRGFDLDLPAPRLSRAVPVSERVFGRRMAA